MFKLHVKLNAELNVEQYSTAYNILEKFMLSGIVSSAVLNVTEVIEK